MSRFRRLHIRKLIRKQQVRADLYLKKARRAWLGRIEYDSALQLQKQTVAERQSGASPDTILLLEHPMTYTIGRSGGEEHLLAPEKEIRKAGGTIVHVDRGGDITYHGPGQLVGYPILDLNEHYRDVHRYLRDLEEVMIGILADYDLRGDRIAGLSGVWIGQDKVGALGVHVNRWVTSHGFALNVNTNLDDFRRIIPCGIPDHGVTSMEQHLGKSVPLAEVAERAAGHLARVFGLRYEPDTWIAIGEGVSRG